jgi:hypothetical protein
MAKKPKKPSKVMVDDGTALLEVARKQAGMSKAEVKKVKKGKAEEKDPKFVASPNARRWLERVKRSEKARKPFLEDSERYWRMYQGDYSRRSQRKQNFDTISVNFVYSHIETISPSVFSGFPYIKVRPKPKTGESIQEAESRARNMELVINYWFKELALDEELKDVFLDTFFGPASIELGWETEIEEKKPLLEDEGGQGEKKGEEITLIKDKPFIVRREFKSMLFDPDARRRRDCRWIGVEEIIPWNDFLASQKYVDQAKKALKPQYYPIDSPEEKAWMGRDPEQSDREWLKIFTIWDKDTRKKYVVADGFQGFLNGEDGEDWPYEIEYKSDPYPFCIHDAKTDRCSPYTWSEFKAAEPQIVEMNRIRSAIQVHVKRSLPKYVYTEAAGNRGDINKLMNARSDEAVKLNNLDAIRPFAPADIPKPLFEMNGICRDDMTTVLGTSEYQNQSLADTATEAQIVEGRSQARKSLRSRQWEQYVVEIAGKLSQLCQQNMQEALAVEIAGQDGVEWLNVSPEQIQGEFYYDIEPGTMEYKNEALRKSQLLRFLEITNGDPNVNRRYLIGRVAHEFDLPPDQAMAPEMPPPQPEPPKPNIAIDKIKPEDIQDPRIMNAIIVAALQQNGVEIPPELAALVQGLPPPEPPPQDAPPLGLPEPGQGGLPPQGGGASLPSIGGKDISGTGMNPNGNPALPPVSGNIMEREDFGV